MIPVMRTITNAIASALALTVLVIATIFSGGCMSQKHTALPAVPALNPATDFATTRTFDAPPEMVWRAWTESEHVRQWWGPRGFTCPLADMNVEVGGTSLVAMKAPPEFGGETYYNTWTYSAVIPPRRLDFVVRFSDEHGQPRHPSEFGLPPGIPAEVPHVLILEPTDEGRTVLTVIEYGYESAEAIELSRRGLESCLDKLAESLRGESAM